MDNNIDKFIKDQLSVWPLAAENYRDLKKVETKRLDVGGLEIIVQHNPCRKISSEAALDPKSLSERPCFLCPENRPAQQTHIEFEGRKGRKYPDLPVASRDLKFRAHAAIHLAPLSRPS